MDARGAHRGFLDPIVAGNLALAREVASGLAILRLAEDAGLPTEPEYEGCPALARIPYTGAPPKDPFRGR